MKFDPQKDYYAILGVTPSAELSAIHRAYKTLVSRYHPDKHQGNELEELAREKLIQINEAYEVLSKSDLKSAYDAARLGGESAFPPSGGGSYGAPRQHPNGSGNSLRKLLVLILVIAALPLVLRFVRSPRVAAVIGIAILLAWFGPRLLKRLKK